MALAVLAGTRPGIVFANDKIDPSAAFIAAPEGSFVWAYLTGDANDSVFQQDLNRWWFDDCGLGQDVAFSFLVCDDATWEPALASILQPRVVIPDRRLLYTCTQRPNYGALRFLPGIAFDQSIKISWIRALRFLGRCLNGSITTSDCVPNS